MELQQTIEALAKRGVQTAIDLGEHRFCQLDTNCPLAIQVRKIIAESGITLPDLLAGIDEVTNPDRLIQAGAFSPVTGKAELYVLDRKIDIDLTDVLQGEVKAAFQAKIGELQAKNNQLINLGNSMYNTYLNEIIRLRTTKTLRQFSANIKDIAGAGLMSSEEEGRYIFLFNMVYNPQWIISNGERYLMREDDVRKARREAILKIVITPEGQVYGVSLLSQDETFLVHYHGSRGSDCWGTIKWELPGKRIAVEALVQMKRIAVGSLATINYNSLMNHEPPGMSTAGEVMSHATRLGREGEVARPVIPATEAANPARPVGWTIDQDNEEGVPVPAWGRGRRRA